MSERMGSENPATSIHLEQTIQGIIFRTATSCSGRYAYLPLSKTLPSVFDSNVLSTAIAETLTAAPPDTAIIDSIPSNILYTTTTPSLFHVRNLLTSDHFPIPFPHPHTLVNAAIITHQTSHYKLLVICIKQEEEEEDEEDPKPLAFYVYSSETNTWSHVEDIAAGQLLPTRRKPVHAGEDAVYLDLTDRLLVRFNYENQLLCIPKEETMRVDQTARYGDCMGWLHCAQMNRARGRVEVHVWTMEGAKGAWRMVGAGEDGSARGKVVALHPFKECVVFVRVEGDGIVLWDIRRDVRWDVIEGRGARCGPACYNVTGMREVFGEGVRSNCGILHPHEEVEGPEGEIFVVSLSTKRPELR